MTKSFVIKIVSLVLIGASAFAQQPSLAANMRSIKRLFKAIEANLADASQQQVLATDAQGLVDLFNATLAQVPASISSLPSDQQAAAVAGYQDLIRQEVKAATDLKTEILANDTAGAEATLKQMSDIKTEGHEKYNP